MKIFEVNKPKDYGLILIINILWGFAIAAVLFYLYFYQLPKEGLIHDFGKPIILIISAFIPILLTVKMMAPSKKRKLIRQNSNCDKKIEEYIKTNDKTKIFTVAYQQGDVLYKKSRKVLDIVTFVYFISLIIIGFISLLNKNDVLPAAIGLIIGLLLWYLYDKNRIAIEKSQKEKAKLVKELVESTAKENNENVDINVEGLIYGIFEHTPEVKITTQYKFTFDGKEVYKYDNQHTKVSVPPIYGNRGYVPQRDDTNNESYEGLLVKLDSKPSNETTIISTASITQFPHQYCKINYKNNNIKQNLKIYFNYNANLEQLPSDKLLEKLANIFSENGIDFYIYKGEEGMYLIVFDTLLLEEEKYAGAKYEEENSMQILIRKNQEDRKIDLLALNTIKEIVDSVNMWRE